MYITTYARNYIQAGHGFLVSTLQQVFRSRPRSPERQVRRNLREERYTDFPRSRDPNMRTNIVCTYDYMFTRHT